jgi:hypothetical protein
MLEKNNTKDIPKLIALIKTELKLITHVNELINNELSDLEK